MTKWLLIAAGGALGSVLRYAVQVGVLRLWGGGFPAGTLAVNVLGCLLVGFLAATVSGPISMRDEYRAGLFIGILGGFTTFSAFGLETFTLADTGQSRFAMLNVLLSCTLGLLAVWLGYRAAERWLGA